jgi:protein-L-isoaspartate(D-aspartate) O-methyltransferase
MLTKLAPVNPMDNVIKARTNMVLSQIATTSTGDQQLFDTMLEIPRQSFVPSSMQSIAYSDDNLGIGNHRYIIAPATLAKMLQQTRVTPQDTVLDIAVATGYSSAIFSRLAHKVIAMEADQELASTANFTLHNIGITNAIIISSNLLEGHPDGGPYDVIFFNGAVASIPEALTDQLADGGRLVAVTYTAEAYNPLTFTVLGVLTVIERNGDHLMKKELLPITLFPLLDFKTALA